MIISNCPKSTIEQAANHIAARVSITPLSSTGLRHKVKLSPPYAKTIKVEAGTKIIFKHSKATRERLRLVYNELVATISKGEIHDSILMEPDEAQALHLEKLSQAINGIEKTHYKKVSKYRRCSHRNEDRAIGALCWHGFRDFFLSLFEAQPTAYVRTSLATFRGVQGFAKNYPNTAHRNIGSRYDPMMAEDACFCGREES